MNIFLIGAGNMGAAFAKQLSAAGHAVRVASRSAGKAEALARELPGVQQVAPGGAAEAAAAADAVILATGYGDAAAALQPLGALAGKPVIDITNPVTPDYMALTIGHTTSAAEEIAKLVPKARVVKAFNTLFAQVLAGGADFGGGQRVPVFYAGDDTVAKDLVHALIQSLGFVPVNAGGLKNARYLEPLAGLNIYLGYGAGLGVNIAPAWLAKA